MVGSEGVGCADWDIFWRCGLGSAAGAWGGRFTWGWVLEVSGRGAGRMKSRHSVQEQLS